MKKIDWHSGFVSAMALELIANEADLTYEEEHYLANRAQRIDLLIIKNEKNVPISNPIGAIFSKFNICEYKGPGDSLTYGDFHKTLAYTCLYLYETYNKANYDARSYTITFVRESHPYKLLSQLKRDGITITERKAGIYELSNSLPFKTQIIITKNAEPRYTSWLKCLTRNGTEDELKGILNTTPGLKGINRQHAGNVMSIFTAANKNFLKNKVKEEPAMYNAVNELFADEINEMKGIIADKDSQLAEKDSQLAEKDSQIANLSSIIAQLQAQLKQQATS